MPKSFLEKTKNITYPKMWRGILLVLLASLITATASLFWKFANAEINLYLFSGYVLQGLATILLVFAFKYGKLSVLHPMLAMSYVFALGLSLLILGEKVSIVQLLGIALILVGVFFLGKEADK